MSDPSAADGAAAGEGGTGPAEGTVLVPSVMPDGDGTRSESIESPGKVMRIGSMVRQLLEEVRQMELDEPSRERLRDIYETSVAELGTALSPDLRDELARIVPPFGEGDTPSGAELVVAKAQLVGWLEGVFRGIQAALFAQQMQAREQLEQMQHRGLPQGVPGFVPAPGQPGPGRPNPDDDTRPGTYL